MVAQLGIYIDHTQMLKDTIDFTKIVRTVIPEIDIVVAIPRGGNFASSIISDILGIPSSTPDRLIEKECYWTSSQKVENNREYISQKYTVPFDPTNAKILLVDDTSYNSLGTLERAKRLILSKFPNAIVYKTAIYCMERTKKSLDFYCKKISMDHWMEKDILIRRRTQKIGFDMDGVLCEDCSYENVIDEEKYTKFLREAKPYLIPHYKVDYIITARLEKYRAETEEWLRKYKVSYNKLIMQSGNQRIGTDHGAYKSKIIAKFLKDGIFFESDYKQAKKIYETTGVQTICSSTSELIGGSDVSYEYHEAFKGFRENKKHPEICKVSNTPVKKHKSSWLFP